MLSTGSAFIWDGHVWFILSDPAANNGLVLCVNITTLNEGCPDDECILESSDYKWIKDKSAVAFSRARVWDASTVEIAISKRLIARPHPDTLPKSTISKIVRAALKSREIGDEMKSLLL